MVQGSLTPNIIFLGEKLWLVAWNNKKKHTSFISRKRLIKSVKISIKIIMRFLGQNVCHVACLQTGTHTDTQTDTKGNTEDINISSRICLKKKFDLSILHVALALFIIHTHRTPINSMGTHSPGGQNTTDRKGTYSLATGTITIYWIFKKK